MCSCSSAPSGPRRCLIYGAIKSPLAQPRNLVGGHLISALIGVTAYKLLSPYPWLAAALAVATSIAVMHATKTLHPPGGATALIFVMGSPKIHHLGYLYVLMPVAAGVAVMLLVALLVNNLSPAPLPGILVVSRMVIFRLFPGDKLKTRLSTPASPRTGHPCSTPLHHKNR